MTTAMFVLAFGLVIMVLGVVYDDLTATLIGAGAALLASVWDAGSRPGRPRGV